MNIFALDADPEAAARAMCDVHVNKMLTEAGQLLSNAAICMGYDALWNPSHTSHPLSTWPSVSRENWDWLVAHARALDREFMRRTGKGHQSGRVALWADRLNPSPSGFMKQGLAFVLAMPDEYKTDDPVASYRAYYAYKEKSWALKGKINALARHAAGMAVIPHPQPVMEWSEPGKRPNWLPENAPNWKPNNRQLGAAERFGSGRRIYPKELKPDEASFFASLAMTL